MNTAKAKKKDLPPSIINGYSLIIKSTTAHQSQAKDLRLVSFTKCKVQIFHKKKVGKI